MTINHLDTHGYWMVGSSHIYVPSECKVEHSNVAGSDSGRDESGVMHIDWVRTDVHKVSLKYKAMTGAEVAYMENLMQGKEFTFTFLDKGTTKTISAYAAESSYDHYSYASGYYNGTQVYTDFEIHVIEI